MTTCTPGLEWITCPFPGLVSRSDLGPCPCGATVFHVRFRWFVDRNGEFYPRWSIECPKCLGFRGNSFSVELGTLDSATGAFKMAWGWEHRIPEPPPRKGGAS